MRPALPVTIIGGYLGAGKTTLVNHLLRHADGVRIAVLVNEFGALPIDADLIMGQTDNVISIAGGCVCCSYGNDLILALNDLAATDAPPDHVVIESSGVGIPGAIGATINLLENYVLDGIVVIADAETVRTTASDKYMGDTVSLQLRQADFLILNKVDLVAQEETEAVLHWLDGVAPQALHVRATRAAVPPPMILQSFLNRHTTRDQGLHANPLSASIRAVELEGEAVADLAAFAQSLIDAGYFRAKGFVRGSDGALMTVQIVGRRWETSPAPDGAEPGVVALKVIPERPPGDGRMPDPARQLD